MPRLLLLFIALSACATVPAARTGDTAALNETIRIAGLAVTPRAVLEDSRCPVEFTCVWEGRVLLRVDVDEGSGDRTLELDSHRPLALGGGTLALAGVTPARSSLSDIPPPAYRFRFAFAAR